MALTEVEIMKNIIILLIVLEIGNLSFAQTGPGGVSNTSTNGLWLKADDINQTNNTNCFLFGMMLQEIIIMQCRLFYHYNLFFLKQVV